MSERVLWKKPVGRRTRTSCRLAGNDACKTEEGAGAFATRPCHWPPLQPKLSQESKDPWGCKPRRASIEEQAAGYPQSIATDDMLVTNRRAILQWRSPGIGPDWTHGCPAPTVEALLWCLAKLEEGNQTKGFPKLQASGLHRYQCHKT